ncbi:hypothetical protein B0H15DRAFT_1020982 [Mycena belliarum]|uniref:Enoyl reductase (ER) domain-containing protein n=1 Tax=Mycena belliarum TaxID=1033014 RepID=A0AAD6U6R3_9AGAR|nr:hypothetical protein B0H15DRAFT_1020982 [Mycena belliae]
MSLPTTLRQYFYPQLGSFNNLVLKSVSVNPPKSHEVLVKTRAVSLQFRDLMIASGTYGGELRPNLVPCSDMAGEIIAVGDEVKDWKKGDRVCANFFPDKLHAGMTGAIAETALGGPIDGVLTEYRNFPAHSLVAIPDHLSYEEASTLPCAALTAYNALLCGSDPLKAGDTVLVLGTGGVSIFALQFAIASGATVIATSSSDQKLKVATKLGAKHVINYKTTPEWSKEVLKATNGLGVDHIIEVGGNSTVQQSMPALKVGGSINFVGGLGGAAPPVDTVSWSVRRALKSRGIRVGSVAQFESMIKLLIANPETTRPIIDKVFAFDEAKAAFGYFQSQAHVGKVVIKL